MNIILHPLTAILKKKTTYPIFQQKKIITNNSISTNKLKKHYTKKKFTLVRN